SLIERLARLAELRLLEAVGGENRYSQSIEPVLLHHASPDSSGWSPYRRERPFTRRSFSAFAGISCIPSDSAIEASLLLHFGAHATTLDFHMKIPTTPREPELAATPPEATPAAAAALSTPEPGLDLSMTAHDVAMAELRRLLAAWRRHEPGARLGQDAEELHQLRVTARRLDATLGLFKRQLPRPLVQARKTTKAVLRTLGTARDLDVQLAELAQYTSQLPENGRAGAEPLKSYLESERQRARTRMVRALDSEPTRRWLETLSLAGAERGDLNGAERALVVMPERVRRRF